MQCEIISPLLVFIVIMKRIPCHSSPVSLAAPTASQTSFVSFKFFWVPNQSQVWRIITHSGGLAQPSRGTDTFKSGMWFRSTYNQNDFCLKTPRRGCCKVSDEEAPISGDFHEDFVVQTNEEMQTKTWQECDRVPFRNKASNKNRFLWFQSPSALKIEISF